MEEAKLIVDAINSGALMITIAIVLHALMS